MSEIKLLIVDDEQQELSGFQNTAERIAVEGTPKFSFETAQNIESAKSLVDGTFDGAIIDLRLDDDEDGNDFVNEIKAKFRIPTAIYTGNPPDEPEDVKIFVKGESTQEDVLGYFRKVFNTGLTKVFGGRGQVEKMMDRVFWNNVVPDLDTWLKYVDEGKDTENALMRLTMNHLSQILEAINDSCLPEEVYICPPTSEHIQTGSIVQNKESGWTYIIISPACDLAIRKNGSFKTDSVLVCRLMETNGVAESLVKGFGQAKRAKKIEELLKNNINNYYYWLPKTSKFSGGVANFRYVTTTCKTRLDVKFTKPKIQVSPQFVKDLVARFSSYYARQGQPDLNFSEIAASITEN